MRLAIQLATLPDSAVATTYSSGRMPERARKLHPVAARSYINDLSDHIVITDMYRDAAGSLAAIKAKPRLAKPPGRSGHGFGLSIDIDNIDETIEGLRLSSKRDLDSWMAKRGWYCHRLDGKRDAEEWHYNHGVCPFLAAGETRSKYALERRIQFLYGMGFKLSPMEVQERLAELGMYDGEIDGDHGPITRAGIRKFQITWALHVDGIAGKNTQRTLAFVTAEIEEVPL